MSKESSQVRRAISATLSTERFSATIPNRGDPTWYVVGLSVFLFVGFSAYLSVLYRGYVLTGADFGSYVHMFATTMAGEGWLEQGKYVASHPGGSYWGGHFTATLLLFYPLYTLVPSPYTLIVAKSFVLAASIPLVWLLARDRLDGDRLAGWLTASYALNPFLWSAWLFDFQEQSLLPLFVFGAYYAYARGRRVAFLCLFALALLTNEFVVILGAGFVGGLVVAAYRAGRLRNELPTLVGAGVLTVGVHILASRVIARFSTFSGIPPASIAPPFHPYLTGVRASIGELFAILLANPALVFETLSVDPFEKFVFFVALLIPVLFLALSDEIALGTLGPYLVFAWVFTGREAYYSFEAHYPLYLLPFLYIGTIRVLGRIERRSGSTVSATVDDRLGDASGSELDSLRAMVRSRVGQVSGVGQVLAIVLVLNLVGSGAVVAEVHDRVQVGEDHADLREQAFDLVPRNASLLTQNDLYPHVATRPNATFVPNEGTFRYYQERYGTPTPTYVMIDTSSVWSAVIEDIYAEQLGEEYGLYAYQDGIRIYKRGYAGPPRGITAETPPPLSFSPEDFALGTGEVRNGYVVGSGEEAGQPIWFGPYTTLPAGTHTATFQVNATPTGDEPVATLDVAVGEEHEIVANETIRETEGWRNVTLEFRLEEPRSNVEFRGVQAGGSGTITLNGVTVRPRTDSAPANATRSNATSVPPAPSRPDANARPAR